LIPVTTPLPQKHPHAFFKHKAKKFFLAFEKVFRLYADGLHIVSAKASQGRSRGIQGKLANIANPKTLFIVQLRIKNHIVSIKIQFENRRNILSPTR
jgi:hypothetical protein